MDPHAGRAMATATAALNEGPSSSIASELDEEAMWQMNLREKETLQYPERPGELECAYYIRTGLCRFGMTCKFNHPANRRLAAVARIKGDYPERPGQAECQGQLSTVSSPENRQQTPRENVFPERPDQPECQFYMKTGDCKFGGASSIIRGRD